MKTILKMVLGLLCGCAIGFLVGIGAAVVFNDVSWSEAIHKVFSGNMSALIYRASGAFLCLAGMLLLKRVIDEDHLWIASVFGAVLHNTGQMAAALLILRTPSLLIYYPFLLVSGCLAGAFTGACAQLVTHRLKGWKR